MDEIHRFNKAQQDAFLPHVERGTVILVGATTENPSFEIISPLLSRSLVVILQVLSQEALGKILDRTLSDDERGLGKLNVRVTAGARERLIGFGNGDARALLTVLEFITTQITAGNDGTRLVDEAALDAALLKKLLRYDKSGEEHYDLISAFIKSMRDSDPDGALYWLARMLEGGENPRFIARRMVIFASEDIGNADPLHCSSPMPWRKPSSLSACRRPRSISLRARPISPRVPRTMLLISGLLEALQDAKEFGNWSSSPPEECRDVFYCGILGMERATGTSTTSPRQKSVKHTCRNLYRGSGIFGPKTHEIICGKGGYVLLDTHRIGWIFCVPWWMNFSNFAVPS